MTSPFKNAIDAEKERKAKLDKLPDTFVYSGSFGHFVSIPDSQYCDPGFDPWFKENFDNYNKKVIVFASPRMIITEDMSTPVSFHRINTHVFVFETEEDATLFRLKWA